MRKIIIFLLVLSAAACKTSKESVVTEGYDADTFKNLKKDSIKFIFDNLSPLNEYSYYIQYLPVRKVDSLLVFQGDIIISSNLKLARFVDTVSLNRVVVQPEKMIGVSPLSKDRLWPSRTVRYVISKNDDTQARLPSIKRAIAAWSVLGIIFQEIPNPSGDCAIFSVDKTYLFNLSDVGKRGGSQKIYLRSDVSEGSIMHEIGHCLGLWHEHCRPDRDKYVNILTDNIDPSSLGEFKPVKDLYSYYLTEYDYASIMHYDAYAFGITGNDKKPKMTIQTIPQDKPIGQRNRPSTADIAGIKKMYNL